MRAANPPRPVVERDQAVDELWRYCHVLRHDGLDYTDYVEELAQLLFLKVADEKGIELPDSASWAGLRATTASDRLRRYRDVLATLSSGSSPISESFPATRTRIKDPRAF